MKKCPHCGKKLPQEMQFCPYCMEKLMAETPVGDTRVGRRPRRWLWLVAVLLLQLLLCGLWLWRPWEGSAPAKESGVPPFSEVTTTTSVTTVDTPASTTTSASQTNTTTVAGSVAVSHTTTTKNVTTSYTTTSVGTTSQTASPTTTSPTTALCGQGHNWEPITETVHVDEVGHYETKTVEKRVTVFRCALCYQEHLALEDYYAHFDAEHGGDALQGIFRDRYTETEEYREVEEKTWVVDTPAHNQTATVGRRCRVCGKTENNDDKE